MTATLAVNDNVDKHVITTLGGLSGIIVLIAKNFSYAKRYTYLL